MAMKNIKNTEKKVKESIKPLNPGILPDTFNSISNYGVYSCNGGCTGCTGCAGANRPADAVKYLESVGGTNHGH